ncbi:MAG: hypothetical protein AAB547_02345 [Patescibacteria group bacterium]
MSKKSQVVSGFGFAMQIGATMDEIRRAHGVSEEEFHVLATAKGRPHLERMIKGLKFESVQGVQILRETSILKPEDPITFPARDKPIDPNEFFSRSGIYLYGSFRERILPVLKPVASTPRRTYGIGRLKKNAYDREVRPDLPKRHLGNWEDIASLIEMYPNGKEGYYLFYLEGVGGEVFAVRVLWDSGNRWWLVFVWRLDECGCWGADCQVLCPGNAAL